MRELRIAGSKGLDRTISVTRVPAGTLEAMTGTPGLWSDGPTSFFANSRKLVTVDPTEHERDLGRRRWCAPLEKKGTLA